MVRRNYYTLVASLPAMPRFEEAERLPINETRLAERLRMLHPDDARDVAWLRKAIQWESHPPGESDAEVSACYREVLGEDSHPEVRSAVEFRLELRTVLAALRRRQRGEKDGPSNPDWGVGRWVRHIENHWTDPDFKLAHVFPWLPKAREHLANGEALALEKLVMNLVWDSLERSAVGKHFVLENILVFLSKWDILRRWLSYGEDAALRRFEELTAGLLVDHDQPKPTVNS
jgi:hypothetical protein